MPEKDKLDLLLDSALSTYADPAARPGLEERVLAALDEARRSRARAGVFTPRRRWLPWAIAVPVVVCLLVWLLIGKNAHAPSTQPAVAVQPNPPVSAPPQKKLDRSNQPAGAKARGDLAAVPARLKSRPVTKHVSSIAGGKDLAALPKLDVFPTPQPLTPEERALVVLAGSGPPSQREALIKSEQQPDAPLSIAALNIPPLAAPGGETK
jgi:hypothetical protein